MFTGKTLAITYSAKGPSIRFVTRELRLPFDYHGHTVTAILFRQEKHNGQVFSNEITWSDSKRVNGEIANMSESDYSKHNALWAHLDHKSPQAIVEQEYTKKWSK